MRIGKQSQADDHSIVRNISEINGKTLECVVSAHRSIRRLQPNDPNRWDSREIDESQPVKPRLMTKGTDRGWNFFLGLKTSTGLMMMNFDRSGYSMRDSG